MIKRKVRLHIYKAHGLWYVDVWRTDANGIQRYVDYAYTRSWACVPNTALLLYRFHSRGARI